MEGEGVPLDLWLWFWLVLELGDKNIELLFIAQSVPFPVVLIQVDWEIRLF